MRRGVRRVGAGILLLAALLAAPAPGVAAVAHDAPASLLVYPLVQVATGAAAVDTTIRLTNVGDAPQAVRCVYVDGSRAAGSAADFRLVLGAGQPLAWSAAAGLAPLPGAGSGTIPAVPVVPFTGILRCVAAEPDGTPAAGDVLIGSATLDRAAPDADSATYAAVGFEATSTSADEPDILVLGGPQGEYAACPAELALQPFLDGAVIALGADAAVERASATTIAIATCSSDPVGGAAATLDLRLTTELGEQFTARRTLREHLVSDLSRLDTTDPSRSIFNSAMSGSPAGHLRIVPASPGSGVLAFALAGFVDPDSGAIRRAALPTTFLGERGAPADLVDLAVPTAPPATCAGDCSGDGAVAINELITGVNIALGSAALTSCPAFDRNADGAVAINELITAVNAALTGC